MITVHHLNNSRSQRVLWLLEELELPYEIKRYERDTKTMLAPAALRAVHPLGKSPTISDGERVITESGAILEYLVERYGQGRMIPPPDSDERLRYRYWMHYAEGSLMPLMLLTLVLSKVEQGPIPFFAKPVANKIVGGISKAFVNPQTDLHVGWVESELARSTWFAGDELSAADVQMSFPLEAAFSRAGASRTTYPRIAQFLDRVHQRPAFQRAFRKVSDFMLAPALRASLQNG